LIQNITCASNVGNLEGNGGDLGLPCMIIIRVMKRAIIFLLAIFLYFTLFGRDVLSGRVKSVIDGNTLEVELGNQEIQIIQLAGIDSPELGQAYGNDA
jgi:endonuclease YncB( thermonuclease family)